MNALLRSRAFLACAIMAIAAMLYFHRLDTVKAPIWDETYYLTSTARYHEGRTQFGSHPPLGMMLIATGDMASGRNAGIDWSSIGANDQIRAEEMPSGFDYLGPRFAPAVFGVIAAGLFALLMLELTSSTWAAALLSMLFLADSAIAVQVRSAQLDPFQLAFVIGAILAAVHACNRRGWLATFAFGAFAMAAALVRANAFMLALMVPFLLWPAAKAGDLKALLQRIASGLTGGVMTAGIVLAWFIALTPLPPDPATPAGQADLPFLSESHRTALATRTWSASALIATVGDNADAMAHDLATITKSDANGSHPGDWLLGGGLILYRFDRTAGPVTAIGLAPNLAIWLVSLFGVASSLRPSRLRGNPLRQMLLLAWVGNMTALQYLDGMRVLYLYHYFIPLMLGHALAAMEWKQYGLPRRPAAIVAIATVGFFIAVWPFAIGDPVPPWACRMLGGSCPA